MKTYFVRLLSALLLIIMVVSIIPNGIFKASATSAATQNTFTTGDIITFGSYPQTKVTDAALITLLNAQTLQSDSTVTYEGLKYKRVYFTTATNSYQAINGYNINTKYWFKFEPIQWRVLSNAHSELFVIADKILDSKAYNQENIATTWETCTMRSWLNNDFYYTAFNSTEQSRIKTSFVWNNRGNPWYGIGGSNPTNDKLFLLSYDDTLNSVYGFIPSNFVFDTARQAQGSDFAKSHGLAVNTSSSYLGNSGWWLRSPGFNLGFAGYIIDKGSLSTDGSVITNTTLGARPVFIVNLTTDIITSKVGSNCIINSTDYFVYGLETGITSLENYVTTAPGFNMEYVTTINGFGTGTVVNVKFNGMTIDSYKIIIYGDVNGDGCVDSIDAGITVDVENYMINWDPTADAAFIKAGDVNGDGKVDSMDAGIVIDAENYMLTIDQTSGLVIPN